MAAPLPPVLAHLPDLIDNHLWEEFMLGRLFVLCSALYLLVAACTLSPGSDEEGRGEVQAAALAANLTPMATTVRSVDGGDAWVLLKPAASAP